MDFNESFIDRFNATTQSGTRIDASFTPGTPGQLFIHVEGDIEIFNAHTFGEAIIETIRNNTECINSIIFDFHRVHYLSSAGVGAIIHILTIPESKELEIFFLSVNEKIQSVFRVLGFANLIHILKDDSFKAKFPIEIECPHCGKPVRLKKEGNNVCPHCDANFNTEK
ncbi:MAG: STAS domain-containing protein [Spirochaetales bacterium]|nr:STAS domain-containing protein [Spirochaetales bacterium]